MKRAGTKKHMAWITVLMTVLLLVFGTTGMITGFTGCATITPAPEQKEAVEKMAARTTGYALAREEPELAATILPYVDLYLEADTWQQAAIEAGVGFLLTEIQDPMIRAMIEDVIYMIKIPEAEQLKFNEARLRNAMAGFREGLDMGLVKLAAATTKT